MIRNWKTLMIAILAVMTLWNRKKISAFIDDCRIRELLLDSVDYIWRLPQGARFALLSLSLMAIAVLVLNYLTHTKGGDGK